MSTESLFIVCTESGTIIPFHQARIINTETLDDGQYDCFALGGDREICELALEVGQPITL